MRKINLREAIFRDLGKIGCPILMLREERKELAYFLAARLTRRIADMRVRKK